MKKVCCAVTALLFLAALLVSAQSAKARLANGKRLFDKENYDAAIQEFTEAIRLDPKDTWAYNGRGLAYLEKGNYTRAIADCTEAIKLDPKNVDAYYNRGNAYADKRDYDSAITDFTDVIKLDPKDTWAYNDRGLAYANKGDYDRAIVDFNEALRIDPNNNTAKINKNNVEEQQQRLAREKANRYDPSKFTVVPSDFKPTTYTKIDLTVSVKNMSSTVLLTSVRYYVSDVVFVRQNGTDIVFRTSDNAISQSMTINQRSGLKSGQKVRVYYLINYSKIWKVIAIERL